jgi:hypothetical protein
VHTSSGQHNPTCRQFRCAYKKLLVHAEIKDGGIGNCISLEEINKLNVTSLKKKPEDVINYDNYIYSQVDDCAMDGDGIDEHRYLFSDNAVTHFSEEVITYISGFVSKNLGQSIKCEKCVGSLFGEKVNLVNSLIDFKNRGGLTYPSKDVINVCLKTEKLYRIEDKIKVNKIKIIIEVLGYFSSHLGQIFVNTFHEHTIFLIRAIVDNYLNTRIKYKCRNTQILLMIRNILEIAIQNKYILEGNKLYM